MLGLGTIGIFLPILPTTPFVLVAAACFAGTPALHSRVTKIPFVNEYITNYRTGAGLPRRTVAVSLSFLWVTLIVSALLSRKLWIVLLLAVVGVAVTVHIVMTARPRAKRINNSAMQ
ncbi:hypothetical protein AGMMS49992_02850 [Clostridia bacterium]|nr:hypothetical protein AGMMS49992_02850 [Clostridia bacterium]